MSNLKLGALWFHSKLNELNFVTHGHLFGTQNAYARKLIAGRHRGSQNSYSFKYTL